MKWGEVSKEKNDSAVPELGAFAVRGATKILSGQGGLIVIQALAIIILARLLNPSDYGLVAMALAFLGAGHLLKEFGLSSAAIQAKNLSIKQRDNLFWINAVAGCILAILAAMSGSLIATFYHEPAIVGIVWGLAPTFILTGVATQYRASLVRSIRVGRLAAIDLLAASGGLVGAIIVALAGGGYWALVAQQLIGGALSLAALVIVARWIPGWYARDESMRSLFSFGIPVFGAQAITYFSSNLDAVLMGRLFGPVMLGSYNRGLQIVRIPMNQARGPLGSLSLSILSKLHDNDERFLRFVERGQLLLSYPLLFGAGMLAATAPEVISITLGLRWIDAAPFVRFIAIGEGLTTLATVGSWIYMSRGLSASLMRYTVVYALLNKIFIIVGSYFGPIGIAAAFAFSPIFLWPLSILWVGKVARLRTIGILWTSYRIVAVCLFASIVAYLACFLVAERTNEFVAIGASLGAALIALVTLSVIPSVRRDYKVIIATARQSLSARH